MLVLMMSVIQQAYATTYTYKRYPPYRTGKILRKETGGWLGLGRIYRAEINKNTGYMYVQESAKSVLWFGHSALVEFEMGDDLARATWVPSKHDLTISIKLWYKGVQSSGGLHNTGYTNLRVSIEIYRWDPSGTTKVVDQIVHEYIIRNGVIMEKNEADIYETTYYANFGAYYFATVKVLAQCESGYSGAASIDYGNADNNNYLNLMWIQYHCEPHSSPM